MSSFENDPPEFVGRDHSQRADPVPSKRKAVAPVAVVQPLAEELAAPTPAAPNTHKKFAVVRPAKEYEAAQTETRDAHAEQVLANRALADAELVESDALTHWLSLQPKPDTDKLLHDFANRSTAMRAQNVAEGRPAEAPQVARATNTSPIDQAALHRARSSAQMPGVPLRSPVVRR